jgi:hypothetical protein
MKTSNNSHYFLFFYIAPGDIFYCAFKLLHTAFVTAFISSSARNTEKEGRFVECRGWTGQGEFMLGTKKIKK